ncbi:hypothetical protein ACET3Z_002838 [Daucus carota]
MAEEAQYDASTNKRKYGDESTTPPLTARVTGFSGGPSPDTTAPSYNSVPPPADPILLARQKAMELAARFSAEATPEGEAKRPRFENGDSYEAPKTFVSGFSSAPSDIGQKPLSTVASIPASYGYGGNSKKIEIPNNRVGVIIGKGGETIKYLQIQSGAKIQVTRDTEADPNSPTRGVELMGNPDQIAKAEQLITDVLSEAESGGSGVPSRRTGQQGGNEQFVMMIPNNKVGLIIGKGGETIKNMQSNSGARIQVIPLHPPPGDTSTERTLQIDGTNDQIEAAKVLVNEVINSENRLRNPAATGYSHQGYQARPPAYGYVQPGGYSGQTPQYNMTQPQYAGYPSQPGSGGYGTGWDHNAAATNQQTTQVGAYDYYSQQPAPPQQAPGAPGSADISGYAYGQQAVSGYSQQGQSYTQDGYGGYHAPAPQTGYSQPQPVYDQQQAYNTTSGYSNVANATPDGQTPSYGAQGDGNQAPPSSAPGQQGYTSQQPSPNSAYPSQMPTQPGYGVPPTSQTGYGSQPPSGYVSSYGAPQTQKPPATQQAYGQTQQSPSAQGGYVQPAQVQPGYPQPPPSQTGYAQPDPGAQRVPAAGYSAAQASGYAPPPYGAPPATQSAYGQPPPTYNNSYGNAYSQPPAYTADANAAPASQSVPASGVAKTSPQN